MRTAHQLAAAAQVAKFIDAAGNDVTDAHTSYALTSTDQSFTSSTLRAGEALLIEAGMLRLIEGRLTPTERLAAFVSIGDATEAAATLDRILDHQASEDDRALAGAAGEEFVLATVKDELHRLHRPDAADRCERVSLISDAFGYDINAPTVGDTMRRLEVKTQTVDDNPSTARFFLTRNEYDTGRSNPAEWALVACSRARNGDLALLGWCRAATLTSYLPADQGGKWTEALVKLPLSVLSPGFPAPT